MNNKIADILGVILTVVMMLIMASNLSIELDETLDNGWLICIWVVLLCCLLLLFVFLVQHTPRGKKEP